MSTFSEYLEAHTKQERAPGAINFLPRRVHREIADAPNALACGADRSNLDGITAHMACIQTLKRINIVHLVPIHGLVCTNSGSIDWRDSYEATATRNGR